MHARKIAAGMWIAVAGGCSTAHYQSYSPSARTMSDHAEMKDYYVGVNFRYSVDRKTEYHSAAASEAGAVMMTPAPQAHVSLMDE